MSQPVDAAAQNQAFVDARTFGKFSNEPVTDATVQRLHDLLKWGPTSMNCQPGRFVFVRSAEAKARLRPALSAGNADKTMAAPATVIVALDTRFYDKLPAQFPPMPGARDMFAGNAELAQATAFRNSSLQGAYLIIAARLLGLDCGPMSGFDNAKVDAEFFPDGQFKSNFLINIGYGDATALFPRGPRLALAEAVQIL